MSHVRIGLKILNFFKILIYLKYITLVNSCENNYEFPVFTHPQEPLMKPCAFHGGQFSNQFNGHACLPAAFTINAAASTNPDGACVFPPFRGNPHRSNWRFPRPLHKLGIAGGFWGMIQRWLFATKSITAALIVFAGNLNVGEVLSLFVNWWWYVQTLACWENFNEIRFGP